MKHINPQNLPEPFVKAVSGRDRKPKTDSISVTELIKPPQMRALEREHWDEIEVDVATEVYALLGTSVHSILEKAGDDGALSEERLRVTVNGDLNMDIVLGGMVDRLDEDGTITDWKVTSVYSFILGDKQEWIEQLNCYAALYRSHGFDINKIQIIAILRDWTKRRAKAEEDYPDYPVMVKELPLWPKDKTAEFIKTRIRLHQDALESGTYPKCTDQERWARDHKWAVMKKGNKRAKKLFTDEEEADIYCQSLQSTKAGTFYVEYRPAEAIRCKDYCHVAPWCGQWKKEQEESNREDQQGEVPQGGPANLE